MKLSYPTILLKREHHKYNKNSFNFCELTQAKTRLSQIGRTNQAHHTIDNHIYSNRTNQQSR